MRHNLIQQTQVMIATATTALDSILALPSQLFADIDAALDDPTQADRINALDKQIRDIDMAIGQVRIYLLGFHRTLASAQALAQRNIEIPHLIVKHEKPWLVITPGGEPSSTRSSA